MRSKLRWDADQVIKSTSFMVLISLIIGIFKKEALLFGLGGLVSLLHFYMIFGSIQNNWKVSNYFTRSSFLLLSILLAVWLLGNDFWYFLPGLFLTKGIIIIFLILDMILN